MLEFTATMVPQTAWLDILPVVPIHFSFISFDFTVACVLCYVNQPTNQPLIFFLGILMQPINGCPLLCNSLVTFCNNTETGFQCGPCPQGVFFFVKF